MSKLNYFLVIFLLLIFTLLKYFYPVIDKISFGNWQFPILYLIILGVTLLLFSGFKRNKDAKSKQKTVLILTGVYLIVFLLIGLIINFERNIYWGKWLDMVRQLFNVIPVIVIQEVIRVKLIDSVPKRRRWIYFLLIIFTFFLLEFDFKNFNDNFVDFLAVSNFIFGMCILGLARSALQTYIAYETGLGGILINRILMLVIMTITPILPNLNDRFFIGMYEFIFIVIFWFVMSYESMQGNRDLRREVIKKSNPVVYLVLLAILLLFVGFQIGFFKYSPTAIISNSMKPVFIRGDAVVVKKLTKDEKKELEVGDIIEYNMGNRSVVHRIIEIDRSDKENLIFTTMGDYNTGPDASPVEEDQIKGKMEFSIPWIGYPSVYFIQYFDKNNDPAPVETGRD